MLFNSRGYFALFLFFYFVSLRVLDKRTKPRSSSAANQALGLRLDGFICSNTVLGECCARQVRTYSSQAYSFVLPAQAYPIPQRQSPHVVIYVTPILKQCHFFHNQIIVCKILTHVVRVAIQNLLI